MGGFSTITSLGPRSQVSATSGGSVNVTSVAQAVWSYTPRSLTDIQSLVTAIQNNDPSLLSTLSDILYVPAPYFAGQVSATQVAAFLDNLVLNYGLAGPVAAAISASPYGLWSTNFVTQVMPYMSATSIAQVLYSGQTDANRAQLILYTLAQSYYYNKWIYTVTVNAPSSITFSTNATLSTNVLIAQNITIASGVTVTCGTHTCFFVAQSFNNYGTVVSPYGAPGGAPVDSAGAGGTGGGSIVVAAVTAVLGTLNVNGNPGGNAVSFTASGTGGGGSAGIFYVTSGVTVPLGGTGGNATAGYIGAAGVNGGGGGGSDRNYLGAPGGNATVYSLSSPNAMVTYILQGLSDWWLINVLAKAPSSTTPLIYMYGSGGGAGAVTSSYQAAGGGGGGAGEVVAYGYNVVSGNITAVGGTGGGAASSCSTCPAGGGGGGAGGLVFIFYGATSGTITASLAGGAGGTGLSGGSNGAAGSTGVLQIAAVTVNG